MSWEILIGSASGVVAALIGSLISAWLNFRYQKDLLRQQLEAQRELFERQMAFEEKVYENQRRQHYEDNLRRITPPQ